MHTTQYQYTSQNPTHLSDATLINIFNDLIDSSDINNTHDNLGKPTNDINFSNDNDENKFISEPQELSNSIDPIEQLLMSTYISPSHENDFNNNHFDPNEYNSYLQNQIINSSPTYNTPLMMDTYFNDNESMFQLHPDLEGCNSLHDYSSISNIIYTKKIKEKLRKKRYASSSDLTMNDSNSKIFKTSSSGYLPSSSSKRSKLRSKSVGAILSQRMDLSDSASSTSSELSNSESLSSPASSNESSPNSKAINPFYHPPEILKRLSNP